MTAERKALSDARFWIEGEVAKVESLIAVMPQPTQEQYRESSFPHAALRVIDATEALLADLEQNSESGSRRASVYFPRGE